MHLYLCNFIGQVILTSLPEILKEDELQRQNDIKRKRHKMLYKSKLEIFLLLKIIDFCILLIALL